MRTRVLRILAVFLLFCAPIVNAQTRSTLEMYLIDVEGGNATLFVTPNGESLLIDTGNTGAGAVRDAERIMAAVKDAGLQRIDNLIITHWHGDHFGGVAELAKRIPIGNFIDHGPNIQANETTDAFLNTTYAELYRQKKHTVVKPGDRITLAGTDTRVVASAGSRIESALPNAGRANPLCASFQQQAPDNGENAQSVGIQMTFGNFRTVHLGDLTANKEFDLMCPNNRIGTVDLFIVSHHGQAVSNTPVLVHAMQPRVMIMNNGTRKGGQPDAMKVLHSSPGLEDLWQLHFSLLSGQEYTVPGMFIANAFDDQPAALPVAAYQPPPAGTTQPPAPVHNGTAYWIKVSAQQDGSFTVTNSRNGFSKTYPKGN